MYERSIEELIRRFPYESLGLDRRFRLVANQHRLPSGKIIDLLFEDPEGIQYIVELKRHRITEATLHQTLQYVKELQGISPGKNIRGVVAAYVITDKTRALASIHNILCWAISEETVLKIADREGVQPDGMFKHPTMNSDPKRPILHRQSSRPVSTSEPERVEFVRALNAKYPPGTMDRNESKERIHEYWRDACPTFPPLHQQIAAELTLHCLRRLKGATVGRRCNGRGDSYTAIVTANGNIVAAIDARKNWVKCDFLLPSDAARQYRSDNLVVIDTARRAGHWVFSHVPKKLSVEMAKRMLDESFEFEFGQQGLFIK